MSALQRLHLAELATGLIGTANIRGWSSSSTLSKPLAYSRLCRKSEAPYSIQAAQDLQGVIARHLESSATIASENTAEMRWPCDFSSMLGIARNGQILGNCAAHGANRF